jgi:ubiquinone/menaquinone biosynthesis C-methylase UbiE
MPFDLDMRQPLERLMRHHARRPDAQTERALAVLRQADPSDTFSLMQWSVGLPYFQQRLCDWELSGEACLDFGCGTGNWTLAASRVFDHVVGVDIHPRRLNTARLVRDALEVKNVSFEVDCAAAAVRAPFDCLFAYNVLPYVHDRAETLVRLVRLLKPAARVVISFNEIGVWPYFLFDGIRSFQLSYVKRAFVVPAYFCAQRFLHGRSIFESTHGWLLTGEVVSFFHTIGFDAVWTSWGAASSSAVPLFPHRRCGLPFFREIVFKRRA